MTARPSTLLICVNPVARAGKGCCAGRGSVAIAKALEAGVRDRRIDITVERIVCLGQCAHGPTLRLAPGGAFILGVAVADVPGLLDRLEAECGVRLPAAETVPLHLLGS